MPGFGHGPFGHNPFGRAAWSKQVLFDSLPSIYRDQDQVQGGILEQWVDVVRPSFDELLEKIRNWSDLRNPLEARTRYDDVEVITLGKVKDPDSKVEQRGIDGKINADRTFSSNYARFRQGDEGKSLTVINSSLDSNNKTFKIISVIDSSTVRCDPPMLADSGPIRWLMKSLPIFPEGELALEIRGGDVSRVTAGWVLDDGNSTFEIAGRKQFFPITGETRSLTEREGIAGTALSDGRFQAEVSFSQRDLGKPFTVSGSVHDLNNGKHQIYAIDLITPSILSLSAPLAVPGDGVDATVTYTLLPQSTGTTVAHVVSGVNTPLSIEVRDQNITVFLATNSFGNSISTSASVAALVNSNLLASLLASASASGTGLGIAEAFDRQDIPGTRLSVDSGLTWALLPFPELRIISLTPPRTIIEQEGTDLSISGSPTNQVTVPSAQFSSVDVGKVIGIRQSVLGSNGTYPILTVIDSTNVTLDADVTLSAESGLLWEIRDLADETTSTTVAVRAQAILPYLGADLGIDVDDSDTADRQRLWVEGFRQWVDIKSSAKSFEVVGALSGYDTTAQGLYRTNKHYMAMFDSSEIELLNELGTGRSGADGTLTTVSGLVRFNSPTAVFKAADVGLSVRTFNCSNSGNNDKLFEIATFINSTTVEAIVTDSAVTPDYGLSGSPTAPTISWSLVRIYSTVTPPGTINMDEVNVELMQDIVGQNNFLIDNDCGTNIESFTISITAVTPGSAPGGPSYFTVTVTGLMQGTGNFSTARVIADSSVWSIKDAANQLYYVESLPVLVASGPPEVHKFQVLSNVVPTLGTATMTYLCHAFELNCEFCRSNVILCRISEGDLFESL